MRHDIAAPCRVDHLVKRGIVIIGRRDVFVDIFMLIDNTVSFGPISRTLVTGSTRATPLDTDERCTLKPPAAAVDPARRRSGCAPVFVILM
jgi:hypothetical protein